MVVTRWWLAAWDQPPDYHPVLSTGRIVLWRIMGLPCGGFFATGGKLCSNKHYV